MKKTFLLLFLSTLITVSLSAKGQYEPIDTLKPYDLEAVTVYATRRALPLKNVPAKIEVIPQRLITNSSYSNLADLLKMHSSIDVIQYPGYLSNIGIRGFKPSGQYVSVMVDGVPVGTDNISAIALTDVAQIEVLKGPFSSLYGSNAMGGVINLITTKHKGSLVGSTSFSLGSYQASRGAFNLGGRVIDKLSFDLNLSYDAQGQSYKTGTKHLLSLSKVEKAILDPSTEGIRMMGSNFSASAARLRLGYDFNDRWSLDVIQGLFLGADLPTGGSIWGVYGNKKKDIKRSSTSIELLGRIGDHKLQFRPYYNEERGKNYNLYSDTAYVSFESTMRSYGAILQDNFSISGQHFTVGIDSRNMHRSTSRFKSRGISDKPYQPAYGTANMSVFAQSNLSFFDERLNISAGARWDLMFFNLEKNSLLGNVDKKEAYNIINPNIGLKYSFVKGLALHSSFGTAFTAPDAYQKAGSYDGPFGKTIGNPNLRPEKSATVDVGLSYNRVDYGIFADVTFFHVNHRDFILSQKVTEPEKATTYINTDKARMSGLEVLLSYDFGALMDHRFSLRAFMNGTFMFDSKFQLTKQQNKWSDLYYVRKQNITFGLEYRSKKGFECMLNGRFSGHRIEQNWYIPYKTVRPDLADLLKQESPDLAAQGLLRHPQSLIFDASLFYHINDHLTVGLNANNLFDEHFAEKDGYPLAGRNIMFKASYKF